MFLSSKKNKDFVPITEHVLNTAEKVTCSGAAAFVIHNDKVVLEAYFGSQSNKSGSRKVQKDTQFHVASVRKSYIGFAVACAVYYGKIKTIDDLIEIDEALGSRIHQKTKGYRNIIRWETGRNWRLKE